MLYNKYEERLQRANKILVYGTGEFCKKYFEENSDNWMRKIIAFADSDLKKKGKKFFDNEIVVAEDIKVLAPDLIIIASNLYEDEIRKKLILHNISENEMISLVWWSVLKRNHGLGILK